MVKKLKKAGVSNTEIVAITGHKSEDSLKHYDEVDIDDHRRISRCISGGNPLSVHPKPQLEASNERFDEYKQQLIPSFSEIQYTGARRCL